MKVVLELNKGFAHECEVFSQALNGLKNLTPIAKSYSMTTPKEVVEQILQCSLERPS